MNEIFQWVALIALVVTHYKKLERFLPFARKGVTVLDRVLSWLSGVKKDKKEEASND